MKQEIKILTPEETYQFSKHFSMQKFEQKFDFIYENQIPNVAIVIVSGLVQLISKKKVKAEIRPDTLLGAYNLLYNKEVRYGWRVIEGTELLILEKSDLLSYLEQQNSFLVQLFGIKFSQSLQKS